MLKPLSGYSGAGASSLQAEVEFAIFAAGGSGARA